MTKLIVLITALASLLWIYSCSNSPANNTAILTNANSSNTIAKNTSVPSNAASSPSGTTDQLSAGRDLYVKNCANCHKESGEGGPTVVDGKKMKPDNLTDDRRKSLSDDKYVKTMVEGVEDEGMPSFKDKLTDTEMREIVHYIRVDLQKQDASNVASANPANAPAVPSNK